MHFVSKQFATYTSLYSFAISAVAASLLLFSQRLIIDFPLGLDADPLKTTLILVVKLCALLLRNVVINNS